MKKRLEEIYRFRKSSGEFISIKHFLSCKHSKGLNLDYKVLTDEEVNKLKERL